jgi:hypothetical protein
MRKYLLPSALILALGLSFALAQNITKSVQQSQSPGAIGLDTVLSVFFPNHINSLGKVPSVSSGTVAGSDFSGTITEAASSIGEVLTFKTAFTTAPHCVVTAEAPGVALATPVAYSTVTTALTITHLSQASKLLDYFCSGT